MKKDLNASGSWIIELAELSNMGKREAEAIKKFISIRSDRARTAYGRVAREVPRQFVLGATVNRPDFLIDDTGNRRFWVVEVGVTEQEALLRDRDQLWAEAAHLEEKRVEHNIPKDLWPAAEEVAERHSIRDEIADAAQEELRKLPAEDVVVTASDLFVALGIEDLTKRRGPAGRSVAAGARRAGWEGRHAYVSGLCEGGSVRCYFAPQTGARPTPYAFAKTNSRWAEVKTEPDF